MKKENNWKVGLVVVLVFIIVTGVWVGIIGHYAISIASEEEVRQMNPVATFIVLVLGCFGLGVIISVKRDGNKKENPVER